MDGTRGAADPARAQVTDLDADGQRWLADALAAVRADPAALPRLFAAAGRTARRCADPGALDAAARDPWLVHPADAVRVALLVAAEGPVGALLLDLDRHADASERRGLLRALDALAAQGRAPADEGGRLVRAALRANDPRLVAAALGPFGVGELDDDELAQAVLKAVFQDLDVRRIPGVHARTTPALAAQLLDLALERVAAGRSLDAGVWELVVRAPDAARLARLRAELDAPLEHRRRAAAAALRDLSAASPTGESP